LPRQAGAPVSVSFPRVAFLTGLAQLLQAKLSERLQHPEPRLRRRRLGLQQALVDQHCHRVDELPLRRGRRPTYRFDGLEGTSSDKDGEPPEEFPLALAE